jgi:hypothetical protein
MDPAGLPALQDAVRHMHGCESRWVESVPVTKRFNGELVWQGEVQLFELVGHPMANRAYAWSHETDGGKRRFVAVLGLGPVVDAVTAVRASIAATR